MKNAKRWLALLLSVLMVVSCLSGMVFVSAEDEVVDQFAPTNVEQIAMFKGGQGNPHGAYGPGSTFGAKFTVPEGKRLTQIFFHSLATYANNVNNIQISVYQWDTDYATSVSGKALATISVTNHTDNQPFTFDLPNTISVEGEVVFEATYVSGEAQMTPWIADGGAADGVTYYGNGVEATDAFCFYINIADALPDLKMYAELDFTKYYEDVNTAFNFTAHSGDIEEVVALADQGYMTVKAKGGDPYFRIDSAEFKATLSEVTSDKLDYIVIKYRTENATAGEFFVSRTDGVGWANPMDKSHVGYKMTPSGNWETVIVDASDIWGNVEGVHLGDFRIDPLGGAGSVDIAYIRFYATKEGAEACVASEQGTWTETVEIATDDAALHQDEDGNWYYGEENIPVTYRPASEIDYTQQVGDSYVLDLGTNIGTTNNGEYVTWADAGYTVEGTKMYSLWGANGYILFESLPFADYNTVEIIIGSDPSSDAFPVGFITDVSQPYGTTQTTDFNYSADLISAMCPAGSEGSPNLSGRGEGAGWNGVERMVQLDISDIDYAGNVAIAVGTIAPHTWVIAKVEFKNYYQESACYTYEKEVSGVMPPEIPFNPAELDLKYLIDGPMLDVTGGTNCEDAAYSYEAGYITLTATANDPYYNLTAGVEVGPYMAIKYRTEAAGLQGEMFIGKSNAASGATDNIAWNLTADGEWHTAIVYIGALADYDAEGNMANHIRFDFLQGNPVSAGAQIDIEYIAFFGDEASAVYYTEENIHVLPEAPKVYKVTFVADGTEVAVIEYTEGDTELSSIPAVPTKDGYTGVWEEFTLNNSDITVNAVYTSTGDSTSSSDEITDPAHLSNFTETHKTKFKGTSCSSVLNEDGSITFTGDWTMDTDGFTASVQIQYAQLMKAAYVNYTKFADLPNADGKYNVIVLKVKAPAVSTDVLPYMEVAIGKNGATMVDVYNEIKCDGTEEYWVFDFTNESTFKEDFINTITIYWADSYPEESNIGAEFTMYEVTLYESIEAALAATGTEKRAEETKPQETETNEPTSEPDTTVEEVTTDGQSSGGCKSVVGMSATVAVLVAAAAAVALKKKED